MEFLKSNNRFSLVYGGKSFWECEFTKTVYENENELVVEYLLEDGLKVTNVARMYPEFGAWEWVNYFENTSDLPTQIISELWDCDADFPMEYEDTYKRVAYMPDITKATKIYAPTGSEWKPDEFNTDNVDTVVDSQRINHIYPGWTRHYEASGGRSSEKSAPFFNIHKNGRGYVFAVGWTGQWNCEITRNHESINFKSKVEDTYFRLLPKEKIRTSSIVVMPYEGDFAASQNKWRRLVKTHFSIIGTEGRDEFGPLSATVWGGMTSESVLKRIEIIKERKIPVEYIWMDAGWYGQDTEPSLDEFEGDWPLHTGDWRISRKIHPDALKDVSKAVHDAKMKFLLWFEPERVIRTTPIALKHPEYFIAGKDPKDNNRLLNLGNDAAWKYCFNTLSDFIEELKIDCYRQDFNFPPLEFWRNNDAADRIGITEIKHITGLYRLWDALLEKFPGLIIDNCASGGRRIDIETLRRSIPLWRSDLQCSANYDIETVQCHNQNYNTWMPYSGTSDGMVYDKYRARSAYAPSMVTKFFFYERVGIPDSEEKLEYIKGYCEEYLRLRPYFSEDYYPLTKPSDKKDVWCAVQYNRPSQKDGIIQVFRRDESPYESASFTLRGLCEAVNYLFEDIDGGTFEVSGKELLEKGFCISIKEKHTAKIYFYKEC